ncbi:MAG: hypothetical protein GEU73_13745 [Chloroflexi bacterium]|nr:hypothetical protein [Chloroflexota bacterium]
MAEGGLRARPWRWRRLVLRAVLLAGYLFGALACQTNPPAQPNAILGPKVLPISGPMPSVPGKLLYAKNEGFWALEPSTNTTSQLTTFPGGTLAGAVATSPDSTRVAYSLYQPGPDPRTPGGTDLLTMSADGTDVRLVLAHDAPGAWLGEPSWAADGDALYFTYRDLGGAERIERIGIDGSDRTVIIEGARSPTVSADGQRLAYLAADAGGQADAVWTSATDGTDARRLLGGPEFPAVAAPRFAPSGRRIVFAAVGTPGQTSSVGTEGGLGELLAWLSPRTASAHGIPWDLWLVNGDGNALQRITNIQEDGPIPTWSPDGEWIGFSGELGMYVVDAAGDETRRLSEEWAGAGIAWVADSSPRS